MTFFNDGDHVVLVALPICRLPTYSGTGEVDVSGKSTVGRPWRSNDPSISTQSNSSPASRR